MSNVPNLDAMELAELMAFAKTYCMTQEYKKLFPNGALSMRKHVAGQLACYADWKASAILERQAGNIIAAQSYEAQCETIYKKLPAWAKW